MSNIEKQKVINLIIEGLRDYKFTAEQIKTLGTVSAESKANGKYRNETIEGCIRLIQAMSL